MCWLARDRHTPSNHLRLVHSIMSLLKHLVCVLFLAGAAALPVENPNTLICVCGGDTIFVNFVLPVCFSNCQESEALVRCTEACDGAGVNFQLQAALASQCVLEDSCRTTTPSTTITTSGTTSGTTTVSTSGTTTGTTTPELDGTSTHCFCAENKQV